jgi:hypothetical protein
VTTDGSGNATFSINVAGTDDVFYTATATDPAGNTSEFSRAVSRLGLAGVVSRKTHGGAGEFDVNLPLVGNPGVECRTGGANGDHAVVFEFVNPVTAGPATCGGTPATTSISGDNVTVSCTGIANQQTITINLTNVSSGQQTGDISVPMVVLLGDTTANRSVNSSDIGQTKAQSGQPISNSNFRTDVFVNGEVNSSDISLAKSASGTSVP